MIQSTSKESSYSTIFKNQKVNQYIVGNSTLKERKVKLNLLKKAILGKYKIKFQKALYADLRKPLVETDLTEIYPIISEIKFAKSNLREWMGKNRVPTPIALLGTSSWVKYEPKGVCLIISPWNYPMHLALSPLVSAIASGNTVIIKPSEMTPNTSAVLAELIAELFDEKEVALIQGGVDVSTDLLKLPFNHLYFTGSPAVGKIVMKAAAENLASVTLELGGKSPTIVDKTANINDAARKIVWGRFLNSGQTCIAPDYVLVDENVKEKLINALKKAIIDLFSQDASTSKSYGRIVNSKHLERLNNYLNDAKNKGAKIEIGGTVVAADNYIAPTIVSNIPDDSLLLTEEIFGPILPIKGYKNMDYAINYINSNKKPLALYIFSKSKKLENYIISNTRAGSTCINNNVMQYTNHYLPFGGVNNSGLGKTHGFYGFQEFSNVRSVMKQHTFGASQLLFPPYTNLKQKLADFTIKWL